MTVIEKNAKGYYGFDYMELKAESSLVSMQLDGYESFGWQIDEKRPEINNGTQVTIYLKRNRKIMNKPELIRLQKKFEDGLRQLKELEHVKKSLATAVSIAVGVVGLVFVAGAVFAVTNDPPIIWLCVVLAIVGFLGVGIAYPIFRQIERRKTNQIEPLMEAKRDEIYETCGKGRQLLL